MLPRIESVESKQGFPARPWAGLILGGLAFFASAAADAANTLYRVINLGAGDTGIVINAKAQVAFTHADPWDPPMRAWFYDGTQLNEIGKLGGAAIRTTGLNDHGQVTGISSTASGFIHSFIWSKQRGTADIGTLPGYKASWEPAINNHGEIAGIADSGGNAPWPHAFRWSAANGMEDLGLLAPGPDSSAYARAINDAGMIVGNAWAGGHTYQARGDGSAERPIAITGGGSVKAQHSYAAADLYTVTANVADAKGNTVGITRMIVVSDPSGGMLAGAGTVAPSARPNLQWPGSGGIGRFSFVAPSSANAAAARASTAAGGKLFFSLGGRDFRSDDMRVVSIQGHRATLAGTGTINGSGKYNFTLTTTSGTNDGATGSFALKVWHLAPNSTAEIVDFDSHAGNSGSSGPSLVTGRILIQ